MVECPCLRRTLCRSRNDPSEARCSKAGQLCLEAGPPAGFGLSKRGEGDAPPFSGDKRRGGFSPSGGRRSVAPGVIHQEQKEAVCPTNPVNSKVIGLTTIFQKGGALVPGMIRQGRGARRLLSLGGVRGGVSPSRGGHSVAPGMICRK